MSLHLHRVFTKWMKITDMLTLIADYGHYTQIILTVGPLLTCVQHHSKVMVIHCLHYMYSQIHGMKYCWATISAGELKFLFIVYINISNIALDRYTGTICFYCI